ncbi:MAG: biopolymer transporter ExbD [Bacteroidota bacterium]
MQLRRKKQGHAGVEAGSLSDILFFLMLFFLMVSTLASPNAIKLLLPKAATGQTVPKHTINLSVKADMSIFIDKDPVALADLENALKLHATGAENPTVVLRIDKSVTVENLIQVVDAVNKAKIPMVIATEKSK